LKILHTSDWHLGQYFMGKSRQLEHQKFLKWLIRVAIDQRVDVILVAGDIFDIGSPPSYARELYNRFVVELQEAVEDKAIKLIVLAGNHDSAATLNESKSLLKAFNTHVITNAMEKVDDHVIPITNNKGEIEAFVCAIPFLRPKDISSSSAGETGGEKQRNLLESIVNFNQAVVECAKNKSQQAVPIILTGHLTVIGSSTSDSVRDIYIGSLEAFPASMFPDVDYIALGHIHKPQIIAKSDHIRYSGSPIPLSFDELQYEKKVLIAEFDKEKLTTVHETPVPTFQMMKQIKGDISEIESQLQKLIATHSIASQANVGSEPIDAFEQNTIWLDIEVNTQDFLGDLQKRVESIVIDTLLDVLMIRRVRPREHSSLESLDELSLNELKPIDVFNKRLDLEQWPGEQAELKHRMQSMFNKLLSDQENEEQEQTEVTMLSGSEL